MLHLLRRRWLLVVLVVSALVGAACAKLNTRGNLVVGSATTHLLINDPDASIVDRTALQQDLSTLQKRAELYARLLTTAPLLDAVAKHAGIPAGQVSGMARITSQVPDSFTQPGSEVRANQIRASEARTGSTCSPIRESRSSPSYSAGPSVDAALPPRRQRRTGPPGISGRDGEGAGPSRVGPAGGAPARSASGRSVERRAPGYDRGSHVLPRRSRSPSSPVPLRAAARSGPATARSANRLRGRAHGPGSR